MNATEAPLPESVGIMLADIPLVDAHHHFWELARFPYRWLAPNAPPARFGDKASIRVDYLPETYLKEMEFLPLSASVHVQANCGADNPADETRWLQELSDRSGWPTAAVAEVDLIEPGAIQLIDDHRNCSILRGIRAPVAWDAKGRWRVAAQSGVLSDARFHDAARYLAEHDMVLDMVVAPEQLCGVADFAGAHPKLRIVVNHFGTLEPSRPGNLEQWQQGLRYVAAEPNIYLKLSGLWTIDKNWSPSILYPHVIFALNTLGAGRIMYGSNLPVEGVNCPLARQFEHLAVVLAGRQADEIENVFSKTARAVYRL